MTIREALRQAEAAMSSQGIADARLEAEILLMHTLKWDRAQLYARLEKSLPADETTRFQGLVEQRLSRRPTAYIIRECQFYGIDLYIDERSLVPRPETELLVDLILEFVQKQTPAENPILIADVGTGSGAIAIALALHLPQAHICATDASAESLEVAGINRRRHAVEGRVELMAGNMLEPIPSAVDIIAANLPYVRDSEWAELMPEIRDFEPREALSGGQDGLDKIRLLMAQAKNKIRTGGMVVLEIGHRQGPAVHEIARSCFPRAELDLIPDLARVDRVLRIIM